MSDTPDALLDEAMRLGAAGRPADALALCGQVIGRWPEAARAWRFQGMALLQTGRPSDAIDSFARAMALQPDPETLGYLGVAHCQAGRLAEGIAALRAALSQAPRSILLLQNLLQALLRNGDGAEAAAIARRLSDGLPRHAEHARRAARLLAGVGDHAAPAYFRRALDLMPGWREGWRELALAVRQAGDASAAAAAWQAALDRDPHDGEAWNNLGLIRFEQRRWPEAATCFERALALMPGSSVVLLNFGQLDMAAKLPARAAERFRAVLRQDPRSVAALDGLVRARLATCDWEGLAKSTDALRAVAAAGGPDCEAISPYCSLFLPIGPREQWQIARAKAARIERQVGAPLPPAPRAPSGPDERLRIGYLSADFRRHVLGDMIWQLLAGHDRARFEVFAYATNPPEDSAHYRKFSADADHFRDLSPLADRAAAERIQADALDLLIFLGGHTDGDRAEILALRPAPLQAAYLDYPATMGASWIDYVIADTTVMPPEIEPWFTEHLLALPGCYQLNNDRLPHPDERCPRAEAGLPEDGFVFCCFNKTDRLNPELLARWIAILRDVPGSLLWLLRPAGDGASRLASAFASAGLDPSRLVFAPLLAKAAHVRRQSAADLFLDTLPSNAHTTASDALWAGVPVLTLAGDSFAGRVGASLLRAVGLPDLIAASPAAYHARAVELARDRTALARHRAHLEGPGRRSALFDTRLRIGELEAAYDEICRRARRGESPRRLAMRPGGDPRRSGL
jgi:predicted O-linked N-acetylglucosamine transferase (SPINDLY family)